MGSSLDDWDMRSDRNEFGQAMALRQSLDDWDMRSDRNHSHVDVLQGHSLDDWDMRSDRNTHLALGATLREAASSVCFASLAMTASRKDVRLLQPAASQ